MKGCPTPRTIFVSGLRREGIDSPLSRHLLGHLPLGDGKGLLFRPMDQTDGPGGALVGADPAADAPVPVHNSGHARLVLGLGRRLLFYCLHGTALHALAHGEIVLPKAGSPFISRLFSLDLPGALCNGAPSPDRQRAICIVREFQVHKR